MKYNMKYTSILNYYTVRSSQWKMFLEIDVPEKLAEINNNYK